MAYNPFAPTEDQSLGLESLRQSPAQWRAGLQGQARRSGLDSLAVPGTMPSASSQPSPPPTLPAYDEAAQARDQQYLADLNEQGRIARNRNTSALGDLGTRLKQGVARLPGQVAGLADVVNPLTYATDRALISEAADWVGEKTGFQPGKWADEMNAELTPKAQAARAELDRAWKEGSAGEIAAEYLRNPVENIGGLVAESVPLMLAGGAIGRGVATAGKALTAAGAAPGAAATGATLTKFAPAIGEGAISAGALNASLLEQGVDPSKAGLVSAGAGVTTGAFGHAGRRLGERLGFGDMDAILAGTARTAPNQHGLGTRLAGGAAIEGLAEELPQSVTEQMWQNVGTEQPLMEGTARAGIEGAMAGGIMGAGFNAIPQRAMDADRLIDHALSDGQLPPGFTDPQALRQAAHNPALDDVTRAQALSAIGAKLESQDPILGRMWKEAAIDSVAEKRPVSEVLAEIQARLAQTQPATPAQQPQGTPINAQPPQPIQDVPAGPEPIVDATGPGGAPGALGAATPAPTTDPTSEQLGTPGADLGRGAPVPEAQPTGGADVQPATQRGGLETLAAQSDAGLADPGAQDPYRLPIPAPRATQAPMPSAPPISQDDFDRWAAEMRGDTGTTTGATDAVTQANPIETQPDTTAAPNATGAAGRGLGAADGVSAADDARAAGFEPTHVTSDGTPVQATDKPGVYLDAEGYEVEDAYAEPLPPVQAPAQQPGPEAAETPDLAQDGMAVSPESIQAPTGVEVQDAAGMETGVSPDADAVGGANAPESTQTPTAPGSEGTAPSVQMDGPTVGGAPRVAAGGDVSAAGAVVDQSPINTPERATTETTAAPQPTFQVDQRVQWQGKERIVSKINPNGTIRLKGVPKPVRPDALTPIQSDKAPTQAAKPSAEEIEARRWIPSEQPDGPEIGQFVRYHREGRGGGWMLPVIERTEKSVTLDTGGKRIFDDQREQGRIRIPIRRLSRLQPLEARQNATPAGIEPSSTQPTPQETPNGLQEGQGRQAAAEVATPETAPEPSAFTENVTGIAGALREKGKREMGTEPTAERPADYGSTNKVFTKDAADKARELLRRKLSGGTLHAGIDPEILQAGLTLAGYHIEAGARQFGDYAKAMIADLGESARPYLRSWYESVRYYPGFEAANDMTPVADMDAAVKAAEQAESAPQAAEQPASVEATDPVSALTQELLNGAEFKKIGDARKRITEITGIPIRVGEPEAKRADEMIEQAAVRAAREIVRQKRNEQAAFDALVDLQARMPSLNVRTSTSVMEQAYSTPLPLAYLASRLAGVAQGKRVLEPTAGNGALLIETDPKRATVNELNSDRRKALQAQGFTVSQEDASKSGAFKGTFDVVITNPPFGVVREDNGQSRVFDLGDFVDSYRGYRTTEIDHAISIRALQHLEEDGRAVLIIGGPSKTLTEAGRSDAYNGKAKRAFFFTLYNQFRVVDHFTVSGDLYAKQGAAWPVDVIVIDGRGKSDRALPAADVPRLVNTLEDLKNELPGTRQENRPDRAAADRPAQAGGQPARDDAVSGRPAQSGGRGTGVESRQPGSVRDGSGRSAESQRQGQLDTADSTPQGTGERRSAGVQPAPVNTFQATYTPASRANSVGTLVPTNMQTAIRGALQRIQDKHESTDAFVADRLGYAVSDISRYFSAEQVDALALALDNMESGKGFIIGDQTGVGKGRVVAGIIRYAIQTGRTPIFVTEKPNLYGDMMRDLQDIGMPEIRPLVTNGQFSLPVDDAARAWTEEAEAARENNVPVPEKRGTFIDTPGSAKHNATLTKLANEGRLDQHDVIFTTYSQMQTVAGNRTARHAFIESLADGGIVILDESHNAGGQDTQSRGGDGPGKEGRAGFVRSIIGRAHGVFYSSATYAKRPEVMDLYFKTDLGLAGDVGALRDALEAGGVPLQQVVAAMLAESGQYIRREKSFDGIAYDSPSVTVDRQFAEHSAEIMRGVMEFDKLKKKALADMDKAIKAEAKSLSADGSTGGAGAHSTNFTSVMHNNIAQMLLMLKVQPAIDRALAALKAGEKPVIALSNTMGSAIEEYVTDTGLKPGDAINLTYGDLLKRYLQKSRRVTIGNPFGEKETRELTDEELGQKAMAQYRRVLRRIDEIGFSDMPISPIDAIHQALRAEGYKTGEITGRGVTIDYSGKRPVFRRRSSKETSAAGKLKTINAFNSGDLDVIILNQSGSTGLSLHASEKFKDQRPRVMILAQPELNIDTHMQMLGRINRTGQVVLPRYEQLVADIPAEKRPAAILAKKMAMLNASTTAAKDSAVKAKDTPDFMNQYGDQVTATFMSENPEIHAMLDEPLDMSNDGDGLNPDGAIRKVSGRIPLLPLAEQERVYAAIEEAYAELIDMLDRTGQNALEAKTLDLGAKTVKTTPIMPTPSGATSAFQQGVDAHEMDVKRLGKPLTLDQVKSEIRKALGVKPDDEAQQVAAEIRRQQQALLDLGEQYYYGTTRDLNDNIDLDSAKDAKRAQAEMARLGGQYDLFKQAIESLRVGTTIELIDPQGTPYMGVVGKVEHKGAAAKNQLAPGILKFTFYVADAAQHVRLPLSQVHLSESYGWTDTRDIKGRWSVRQVPSEDVEKAFAEGMSESREKRTILTGNMVKGFGFARSGRIINFTDDAGSVRQGILMPKNFDLEKAQSNKPLVFEAPRAMAEFARSIEIAPRAAPLTLASKDGDIKLFKHSASLYALQTEASKKKGGRFFMDRPLIAAAGRDFVKAGSSMRNEFSADRLEDVLGRLYQMGVRLQAQTHKDEVRAWLDANKPTQDDGARFSLADTRPTGDRLTRDYLQARLNAVTRAWPGLKQMPIKVVNTERALPNSVRAKLREMRANGTQAIPRAVFVPGDGLYFVAPNIGSVKEAMLALAEESIGHHGLRAVMGPQFEALLDRVIDERRADVEAMAEQYGLDMADIEQAREAADEFLAHQARLDTQESWFQSIVQAIRAMLRKMGVRLRFSDGDIRALLAASNRYVTQGDARGALKARGRFGGTTTARNQDARFSAGTDGLRQNPSGQVQRGGVSAVSGDAIDRFNVEEVAKLKDGPRWKGKEKLVSLKIDDFLLLAERTEEDAQKRAGVDRISGQFEDLPFLQVKADGDSLIVHGHEGRHRAMSLKRQGYTSMPVVLKADNIRWSEQRDRELFGYLKEWPTKIIGENGDALEFSMKQDAADGPYAPLELHKLQTLKTIKNEKDVSFVEEPGDSPTPYKEDDSNTFFRLFQGDEEIGRIWADRYGDGVTINYSEMGPEYRGKGLYKKALVALAKKFNIVSDEDGNNAAIKIYQQLGAEHRGDRYYLYKGDYSEKINPVSRKGTSTNPDIRFSLADIGDHLTATRETLAERLKAAGTLGQTAVRGLMKGLGGLNVRMLADVAQKELPSATRFVEAMQEYQIERNKMVDEAMQRTDEMLKHPYAENRALMDLMNDSTVEGVDASTPNYVPRVANVAEGRMKIRALRNQAARIKRRLQGAIDPGMDVAALMQERESALKQARTIARDIRADARLSPKHAPLHARFKALPAWAQAMYKGVRDDYKAMSERMERAIMDRAMRAQMDAERKILEQIEGDEALDTAGRDALKAAIFDGIYTLDSRQLAVSPKASVEQAIENAGLSGQARSTIKRLLRQGTASKQRMIDRVRLEFESGRVEGVYFPLQRFGRYYAVFERPTLNDAGEPVYTSSGEPKMTPGFALFDSEYQANLEIPGFVREGWTLKERGFKVQEAKGLTDVSEGFVADVVSQLVDKGDPRSADLVYQMYLDSLPYLSARKHFIHRKKTAGYTDDLPRTYASNMAHLANQIARMEASPEFQSALNMMREESQRGDDHTRAEEYRDEFQRRYEWIMSPTGSKLSSNLTALGFVWHLGISPAAALVNLTQTAIVAYPELASRYGFKQAGAMLLKSMGEALAARKPGQRFKGRRDYATWGALSDEERAAMRHWHDIGAIDVTNVHSLMGLAESESSQYSPKQAKLMQASGFLFQEAEVINREATLLAGYRLAKQAGLSEAKAREEAAAHTWNSHGDYSSANRARWMQGNVARVLFQFKQYSQLMTYFLARNAYLSVKGEDAQTRAEARKKLGGVLGMTALLAGSKGLPWAMTAPLFLMAEAVVALFGDDDDEDWDAETAWRNWLADLGVVGKTVDRGAVNALTGVDLSTRVQLSDLWFRDPSRELEGKAMHGYLLEQAAGPVLGGIGANLFRGAQMIEEGEFQRGAETMMPKFIKDAMVATRFGMDGSADNMKGEPIVADLTPWEIFMKANGFSPDRLSAMYDMNNAAKTAEQRILQRRAALIAGYGMAALNKDAEGVRRAKQKIREYNAKKPPMPIDAKTLRSSLKTREAYRDKADSGIYLNPKLSYVRDETRVPL